ncbi:MAG TPA: hypothetical protein PLD88_03935, partial [Candidatus Berkiella sp.]|nr:hypothetical protein [Candidatus Berkiella sp.]
EVEKLDTWGGEYELKKMSEILGINIDVYSDRQQAPFSIQSNHPQAPTVNLHHTGNHYNFYVEPNAWQELPPHDPVILFEQQIDQIRHQNILAKLRKTETQKGEMATKLHSLHKGNTRQGTPITYENYVEVSKKYHESGITMKRLIQTLDSEKDGEKRRQLELQLKKIEQFYADSGKDLEEMRKAFKGTSSLHFD